MGIVSEAIAANLKHSMKTSDEVLGKLTELEESYMFLWPTLGHDAAKKIAEIKKQILELKEKAHDKFDRIVL